MKIVTSYPSLASAFGSDPHTSPNPPVFAMGETSALAKRIFMRSRHHDRGVPDHMRVVAVDVAARSVLEQRCLFRAELLRGDEHRRGGDEAAHGDVELFHDRSEFARINAQHLVDRELVL